MIIFPAIDIIGGQCVRLTFGDYDTVKVYDNDPLEVAKRFESLGFTHLHMVDLDGARVGRPVNTALLEKVAAGTSLQIDFGGGIRESAHIQQTLNAGAVQVNLGSVAVKKAEETKTWITEFGADKIILSADVRNDRIAIHGWQDESDLTWEAFINSYWKLGVRRVTCTDIQRDGALTGPSLALYTRILERFPGIELIASGGVSNLTDVQSTADLGCFGTIVGKAIYEQKVDLKSLQAIQKK